MAGSSSSSDPNPFDQLELDPRLDARELTELLRRRAERAAPAERKRLQALWRELTLNEEDRLRAGLLAHPRRTRQQARHIEEAASRIPPFLGRLSQPLPPLIPTAADALVMPADQEAVGLPEGVRPPPPELEGLD